MLAFAHAVLTWPLTAVVAFFLGGAVIAFVAEVVVISLGLLEHHVDPKVVGVPVYVLFGWTGAVYVALRVALLTTEGWTAVLFAAVLATGYDVFTDHHGVRDGHWSYLDDLSGPQYRGVPWWNFAGWFVISSVTAGLAVPFL